ncbi:MAG: (2Fe-2S) ferredoxin domain-containing protein [Candidatus Eremiobacteraeota bacterium]|nr:(2Fe-2S) ferredoxin domain-containing protein [Candidatus Eremiobacteraeota bacterium]
MAKLKFEDIDKIKEKVRKETYVREGEAKAKITVHMGTCGIAAGARKVMSALMEAFEKQGIKEVILTTSGCAGLCSKEPMMTVEIKDQAPVKYISLTAEKALKILEEHALKGNIVKEFALAVGSETIA